MFPATQPCKCEPTTQCASCNLKIYFHQDPGVGGCPTALSAVPPEMCELHIPTLWCGMWKNVGSSTGQFLLKAIPRAGMRWRVQGAEKFFWRKPRNFVKRSHSWKMFFQRCSKDAGRLPVVYPRYASSFWWDIFLSPVVAVGSRRETLINCDLSESVNTSTHFCPSVQVFTNELFRISLSRAYVTREGGCGFVLQKSNAGVRNLSIECLLALICCNTKY